MNKPDLIYRPFFNGFDMLHNILLLILGLVLITLGADKLVDGASKIARRFGLSDFLIGMTIVGIGTSAPEMVVSFISAFEGNGNMAIGNIVGSNIFNILAIVGLSALIMPISLTRSNLKRDIPAVLISTALFVIFVYSGRLSRIEGAVLLLCFIGFMIYSIKTGKRDVAVLDEQTGAAKDNSANDVLDAINNTYDNKAGSGSNAASRISLAFSRVLQNLWFNILLVLASLAVLVVGGNMFVDSACYIAKSLGVSDAVIAATILAGGTSLPELATCVAAAFKKNTDMVLGNIIGSNVSNVLLILGGSALITPLAPDGITHVYLFTMLASAMALFISYYTFARKKVDRMEGLIFILSYIAFIWYII